MLPPTVTASLACSVLIPDPILISANTQWEETFSIKSSSWHQNRWFYSTLPLLSPSSPLLFIIINCISLQTCLQAAQDWRNLQLSSTLHKGARLPRDVLTRHQGHKGTMGAAAR